MGEVISRMAASANVRKEMLKVGEKHLYRVHVKPSAFRVDAEVTEAGRQGEHEKKRAFYGRFGNSTREITESEERDHCRLQIWGP